MYIKTCPLLWLKKKEEERKKDMWTLMPPGDESVK